MGTLPSSTDAPLCSASDSTLSNQQLNHLIRQFPQSQSQPLPPTPPIVNENHTPSLSSTLSSLTHIIDLARRTLSALPPTIQKSPNFNNVPCSYVPNHLMPAESLFSHFLRCHCSLKNTASISSPDHNLQYPKALDATNNISDKILPQVDNDGIRVSLDGHFCEFSRNFFYNESPAVVSLKDVSLTDRAFTLPSFLFAECKECGLDEKFYDDGGRILASDLLSVKKEVDSWMEYPETYSNSVLCAVSWLNRVDDIFLKSSVVSGSRRYGLFIDRYMRDHISILFRLCFASIRREAVGNLKGVKRSKFESPFLVRCLNWIGSQFSVLYGNEHAKSFAMYTFKQCVLEGANLAVIGCLEMRTNDIGCHSFHATEKKGEEDLESRAQPSNDDCQAKQGSGILLPQVVASVAALHERSLFERHIKISSYPTAPSVHQRITEYEYHTRISDEERRKRNYRMIIDHDGPGRRHQYNQDASNRIKTVEELLAEERDYKRRRASYRGKKSKRTPVEVMRDAIEEYMEEIKEAEGIGC